MSAHKDALIYPMLPDARMIVAHKGYDGGYLYQGFVERYLAHLKGKDENLSGELSTGNSECCIGRSI